MMQVAKANFKDIGGNLVKLPPPQAKGVYWIWIMYMTLLLAAT